MTRLKPLALLCALTLLACQGSPPPFIGKPRIAGASPKANVSTAASAAPKSSAAPSSAPASDAPPFAQEPAPVPIPPAAAGGTTTTPATGASPALSLVAGAQPSDTWQQGIPLQRARAGLVAAAMGDRIYALEGENSPSREVYTPGELGWVLDTSYDVSSRPLDLDTALRDGRALQTLGADDDALFAAGGSAGLGVQASVVRYTADACDGEVSLMAGPAKAAAGGLVGDTLVVAGGLGASGTVQALTQRLDTQTGAAAIGALMPLGVAGAAGAAIGGKVYVVGGYSDAAGTPRTTVQVYTVATGTWRKDGDGQAGAPAPLPAARHSAAAAVLDGKLYVAGGLGADGSPIATLAVYDPTTNTWATKAAMSTPRALLALAAFQGKLWAIGGYDAAGKPLASVEVYKP